MTVKLVQVTPDAEKNMAYIARVSNPSNQDNQDYSGLLKYCIKHQHWSVFEQAFMTLEIETTRAIAAQILRHRSFTFQEFSQRYANSNALGKIEMPDLRRQDDKNRQNSIDDLDEFTVQKLQMQMNTLFTSAQSLYNQMIEYGVAKECKNGSTIVYTNKTLHDRFMSFLGTLHQSKICTRNTKGTHGHCGSMS